MSSLMLTLFIFWVFFFAGFYIYVLVAAAIAVLALREFYRIIEKKYGGIYPSIGYAISFLLLFFSWDKRLGLEYFIYPLSLSLILLFLYQFFRKTNKDAALCLSLTILGLIYITIPCLFFIKIRTLNFGTHLIAYFVFVSKATDVGAYLIGTKFGKHPLVPRISPKKSVEGFIGGLLFSFTAAYIGSKYVPIISLKHIPAIGLILGVCAQFGDLAESVLKRDAGVKDSGRTIPGLGGVLDLIDSLLISLPFYYLYLYTFVSK
ncbi:MAG: phosphatidate cytidylyltransferase [Candidatus Saelkia tenebricola]|nr:phosphatidate cytidylyltransferase [Candidatus Saelkia tenebricola]